MTLTNELWDIKCEYSLITDCVKINLDCARFYYPQIKTLMINFQPKDCLEQLLFHLNYTITERLFGRIEHQQPIDEVSPAD